MAAYANSTVLCLVNRDWHVGLHIVFIDKPAHDAYQEDATHNKFIDENKGNWAAVRVFDSLV